jgi:magnesium-transporting ATPase (P-type)
MSDDVNAPKVVSYRANEHVSQQDSKEGKRVHSFAKIVPLSARSNGTSKSPTNEERFRKVYLNNDIENDRLRREMKYADNRVATSKYTLLNFIPKTIFEFFRVIANCYFLVISILQVATPWSPTNQYTTAGPLAIVLLVSMIKQGMEDKKRHDADEMQNNRQCKVLGRHGETVLKHWHEIQVGDVLCLGDREESIHFRRRRTLFCRDL